MFPSGGLPGISVELIVFSAMVGEGLPRRKSAAYLQAS